MWLQGEPNRFGTYPTAYGSFGVSVRILGPGQRHLAASGTAVRVAEKGAGGGASSRRGRRSRVAESPTWVNQPPASVSWLEDDGLSVVSWRANTPPSRDQSRNDSWLFASRGARSGIVVFARPNRGRLGCRATTGTDGLQLLARESSGQRPSDAALVGR